MSGSIIYSYVGGNSLSFVDPYGLAAAGQAIGGQIGAWGAGALGIETGPGAALAALAGRAVGGALGSAIEDWLFPPMAMSPSYGPKPARTSEEEAQADKEYQAYKAICNQPPPPGLDKCQEAKWKKNKGQQCLQMRQDWDSKWWPGRHADEMQNVKNMIRNAERDMAKYCKQECP